MRAFVCLFKQWAGLVRIGRQVVDKKVIVTHKKGFERKENVIENENDTICGV